MRSPYSSTSNRSDSDNSVLAAIVRRSPAEDSVRQNRMLSQATEEFVKKRVRIAKKTRFVTAKQRLGQAAVNTTGSNLGNARLNDES